VLYETQTRWKIVLYETQTRWIIPKSRDTDHGIHNFIYLCILGYAYTKIMPKTRKAISVAAFYIWWMKGAFFFIINCLVNEKLALFQIYYGIYNVLMRRWVHVQNQRAVPDFIILFVHWNNSPQINMLLYSDILSRSEPIKLGLVRICYVLSSEATNTD
jgi:hypothetical protein